MMESALLNYGRGGHSVSTPNVQKSDEHRKKTVPLKIVMLWFSNDRFLSQAPERDTSSIKQK